jgi:hypothetical protein
MFNLSHLTTDLCFFLKKSIHTLRPVCGGVKPVKVQLPTGHSLGIKFQSENTTCTSARGSYPGHLIGRMQL